MYTLVTVSYTHLDVYKRQVEAKGRWAMQDIIDASDGLLRGYGHYHENYRKVSGRWRFSSIHLTRLRLAWEPKVADAPFTVEPKTAGA